jgi:glycosyltransferase involved in cell wall biosynthesis
LASALSQTYPNLEILVSDNCSTDNTKELVRSHDDARIRYVRQDRNIGGNNNFNYCVEAARGEYLLLLHDDDMIDPDFVAVCIDALKGSTEVGLVHTGVRLIDGAGNVVKEIPNRGVATSAAGFLQDWFSGKFSIYLCSTLYHTKALRAAGGFNTSKNLLPDVMACAKLAASNGQVAVGDVKASFRRHESNNGNSIAMPDWCEECLDLIEDICNLLPDQAGELRPAAMEYLCKMNYSRVRSEPSFLRRMLGYRRVARYFDSAYSPTAFAYTRDVRPAFRAFGRRIRGSSAAGRTKTT